MRFLICGLGSIGQRHYRNLKALGCDDILVYRSGKGNEGFIEKFVNECRPRIFNDLRQALQESPNAVLVANPTALHIPTALEAARDGCHLFIEKPLSHNLDGIPELEEISKKNNLKVHVGYNHRFHPALRLVKKWLDNGEIGRVVSAHAEMGEKISDWHPWEDYRQSYAARRDLGGGVVLTQSHEIDYLCWLFGSVKMVNAFGGAIAELGTEVEDTAKIILEFHSGAIASVSLDYIQSPPRRCMAVIGTNGQIQANLLGKPTASLFRGDRIVEDLSFVDFDRNAMYVEELKHFVDCIQHDTRPINDLAQGIQVLRVLLAARDNIWGKDVMR